MTNIFYRWVFAGLLPKFKYSFDAYIKFINDTDGLITNF
jgi:hypothetical protein